MTIIIDYGRKPPQPSGAWAARLIHMAVAIACFLAEALLFWWRWHKGPEVHPQILIELAIAGAFALSGIVVALTFTRVTASSIVFIIVITCAPWFLCQLVPLVPIPQPDR